MKALYHAALVLNNKAITLLENGYLNQSARTLSESLSILKLVLRVARGQESKQMTTSLEETVNTKYLRALGRFTKGMGRGSKIRALGGIEVHALDEEDYCSMKAAAIYGSSSLVVFPVLLGEIPEVGCASSDAVRQFGIILYNYGLVQYVSGAASRTSRSRMTTSKVREEETRLLGALKSLAMSEKTFSHLSSTFKEEEFPAVVLLALTLNCIICVYEAQGMHTEAGAAQELTVALRVRMEENTILMHAMFQHTFTAAAA